MKNEIKKKRMEKNALWKVVDILRRFELKSSTVASVDIIKIY